MQFTQSLLGFKICSYGRNSFQKIPDRKEYDIVIIGGGISGLYCGMKLLENSVKLAANSVQNILILEKTDRWGGRLDTDIIKIPRDADGEQVIIKGEKGAMRFTYRDPDKNVKSNMPLLSQLIKDIDMEKDVESFNMEPQALEKREKVPNCNTRYFSGKFFTNWYATQNPTIWGELFDLHGDKEFKTPGEITTDIYRRLLDHNKEKLTKRFPERAAVILEQKDLDLRNHYEDPEYWTFLRNNFTWTLGKEEIPLNKFSMRALMTAMGYSHGCIMMITQTGFLCPFLSLSDSGWTMQIIITFDIIGDRLFQFKNGWSSFVRRVKREIEKRSGSNGVRVEFQKNCVLERIDFNESDSTFNLIICEDDGTMIKAKSVVMAIPPRATEEVLNRSTELNSLKKICRTVEPLRLTKINLYFEDDWWNQTDGTTMFGANTTNLPCGMVYPFYGDCKKKRCKRCDNCEEDPCPAALTIYCDSYNAMYWSSLQSLGSSFQSPLQRAYPNLLPATETVVQEAIRELQLVFNIQEIPQPVLTSYRSWDGTGKYGYGVYAWKEGVDNAPIVEQVAKPIKDKALYMCNEGWSTCQGWVEGSLMSTENAVNKLLSDMKDADISSCSDDDSYLLVTM